ncbi:DUF4368 domain-containing protein [Hungatella hathewayi]|uniref:DUF4368 domain-containing protein n=1 Tax=Hungatella hathewayi TaxID=154046 RepID=UPI003D811AEA
MKIICDFSVFYLDESVPKGTVLIECGKLLQRAGYRIKVLNTINFRKSMHYNPFVYIRSEKDVLKVVNTLIVNTKGEGEKSAEDFWVKAERLLYCALIGYIWYEAPAEEMSFTTLLELINASEAREDDEEYQSPVDLLFADLEERSPDHFAVKQYKKYKLAAGVVCSKRLLNQAVGKSLRTHNLKPKKGAQVMRKNEKITALYERLSRDDFGKDDDQQRESNSISNQKAMLEEFAARQGFTNIVHFTDDGISGTCFDRPGFLAMMKEVEAGNVEYLCIKDMSRMGRDYLKVGQIMEILRQRGVRLIAINDGVDSARGDDDFTPFRNIMNEYYARDTSRKIRSTFQSKVPVGKLCTTQHRINEDVVLSLVSEMLKAIAEYAKHDRAEFVRVVQEAQSSQQTAEVKKQRTRLATAKQRVSELEVLLCKIYEDNILGKLSDSRYATLDAQYEKEQTELTAEISVLEKAVKSYEKHEKDADRFIALIDKYENFDKLTIAMLNEFIEKILVHERDRKGSIQTTQEVEIYFNFVGRFVPPAFGEVELTPEELEEIRKREERKDRLHQNYLKRKANGKQKEYEERTKAKKKAEIEARKQAIRTEDIARGVFIPVSSLPQLGPRKGA